MNDLKFRENDTAVRPAGRFRLDRRDGKVMGVCAGIGNYFGVDTTLVRIGFVIGAMLSVGTAGLIYLAIGLIAD